MIQVWPCWRCIRCSHTKHQFSDFKWYINRFCRFTIKITCESLLKWLTFSKVELLNGIMYVGVFLHMLQLLNLNKENHLIMVNQSMTLWKHSHFSSIENVLSLYVSIEIVIKWTIRILSIISHDGTFNWTFKFMIPIMVWSLKWYVYHYLIILLIIISTTFMNRILYYLGFCLGIDLGIYLGFN